MQRISFVTAVVVYNRIKPETNDNRAVDSSFVTASPVAQPDIKLIPI